MLIRVITSLIGLIVFFIVLLSNTSVFNVAIFIIIAGMLYEMYKAMKSKAVVCVCGALASAVAIFGVLTNKVLPCIIIGIMLYLIVVVFTHGKIQFKDILSNAFITAFVTFFMTAISKTRVNYGEYAVMLVFICAWMTDTCAYFSGYFFGKHKLIPKVSPKKTIEGAIGGVIGTTICCTIYSVILTKLGVIENTNNIYISFAILGCVGSVLAQLGDLVASSIKRDCGIKDFGNLFPGHGGILDRFDSVVFISPFIYYFLVNVKMF